MRIIRILISILLVAFLLLAPKPLERMLQRNPVRELFEPEPPDWYGVIEIWHIAGFRTYQGSVTNFLQDRCDAFSRSHPGVHFEVIGLTPAMYEDRIRRGLSPDAYSFPAGYLSEHLFRPLSVDPPILLDGLLPTDTKAAYSAVPYLMSGYFLLLNEQLVLKETETVPDTADFALLSTLQRQGQLSFPASVGAALLPGSEPRDYSDFLDGSCTAAITDARALGDLLRDTEQTLAVTALPLGTFTDQVMYLGIAAGTDDHRAACIDALCTDLLSEDVQQAVTNLGAIPVRKYIPSPVYATQLLDAWYRSQLSDRAYIDPFCQ